MRELTYSVASSPSLFRKPDLQGKSLHIAIDGKPVDNVSTVSVYLFNKSDLDYEDVAVEVAFTGKDGQRPKLLQDKATTPPSPTPILPITPQTQPATGPASSVRIEYNLKVVNRTNPVFLGEYIFEGAESPHAVVAVKKKGLTLFRSAWGFARKGEIRLDGDTSANSWPSSRRLS